MSGNSGATSTAGSTGLSGNPNAKMVTLSFLVFASIIGFTVSTLFKALSGAFSVMAKLNGYDLFKHGVPVTLALGIFLFLQLNSNVLTWADEVIAEIKKVVWPSGKDTRGMTIVVVVMVLISSVIIVSFDWLSGISINTIIK